MYIYKKMKCRKSWWKTFVVTLKSNQKKKIRYDIESDMLTDLFICFGIKFDADLLTIEIFIFY